jgi:hypothetical protein
MMMNMMNMNLKSAFLTRRITIQHFVIDDDASSLK